MVHFITFQSVYYVCTITVQQFCQTHNREDLETALASMAEICPHVFRHIIASGSSDQSMPSPINEPQPWCKCGKCQYEEHPEDRICCNNNRKKKHESPIFSRVYLDETTVELALINNCDWLNLPKIYTASKFRNTACQQYILWYYGKLGYRNRKRIPSCIK